ncbi:MAG: dienelactone hydrolase family protein [Candidatus Eremiobacteraeota bacterium]|nr:dienelactone hydrolase family protein [Candidatus Eremiobacteraeota bacterium]NNM91962.1 dienelactone hydrolase family protein [Candidatus Eremiobacteraeota bacterium]
MKKDDDLAALAKAIDAVAPRRTSSANDSDLRLAPPHLPYVSEHDTAIVVESIELRRLDTTMRVYTATPRSVRANTPGIVVLPHLWGVDATIRDIVRRFAKAGFSSVAPDLYARFDAPKGDDSCERAKFETFAKRIERRQADGDIRAAALWLQSRSAQGLIGITGFSVGGRYALLQAADNNDVFSCVAPFYGSVEHLTPDQIHIPVCGSYGEHDSIISADEVRFFRTLLTVPNDLRVYQTAGHDFFDDRRTAFAPAAASDAWKRTLEFFKNHLIPNR